MNNVGNNPVYESILRSLRTTSNTPVSQNIPLPPIGPLFRLRPPQSLPPIQILFPPKTPDDLIKQIDYKIKTYLKTKLTTTDARKIPLITDIAHVDEAKKLTTSVLHIDIRRSSDIVRYLPSESALRVYQIFHNSVVETIKFMDAEARTFAGDRVGALFDNSKNKNLRTQAVKTALLINEIISQKVNPALSEIFDYTLEYGIGIDYGEMLVGRIGKYGIQNNDLIWLGEAMNHASKLADYGNKTGIFVSEEIYKNMETGIKKSSDLIWFPIKEISLGNFYQVTDISYL